MFFISVQENKLVKKITPRLLKKIFILLNKNLARALFTFVRKEHAPFETNALAWQFFLILYRKNDK